MFKKTNNTHLQQWFPKRGAIIPMGHDVIEGKVSVNPLFLLQWGNSLIRNVVSQCLKLWVLFSTGRVANKGLGATAVQHLQFCSTHILYKSWCKISRKGMKWCDAWCSVKKCNFLWELLRGFASNGQLLSGAELKQPDATEHLDCWTNAYPHKPKTD